MTQGGDDLEFFSPGFRKGKALRFGLVIALCGLLLYSMTKEITTVVLVYMGLVGFLAAFLAVGFVRAFRTGITLTDQGVVVRTTYSTKLWRWQQVERARAIDHNTRGGPFFMGASLNGGIGRGVPHEQRMHVVPMLYLTNGRDYRLYGLRIVASTVDDSEWIDGAIQEINRRVAQMRSGGTGPARSTPS